MMRFSKLFTSTPGSAAPTSLPGDPPGTFLSSDGEGKGGPPAARGGKRGAAEPNRPMPPGQWLFLMGIVLVITLLVWLQFGRGGGKLISYSFFRGQLEATPNGNVEKVMFSEDKIIGEWKEPPDD